jgi:hypothetical protein
MRYLLAAVLALAALATGVTTASARTGKAVTPNPHNFVGSPNAEPKFTGEGGTFTLKPFTVECEKTKGVGTGITPTFPSKTLTSVVKFSGCEAEATLNHAEYELKAKVLTPVTFNYHANGAVEVGAGGTVKEGKLEGAGPIEIAVSGPFKCTIDIEPGVYPPSFLKKPEGEFEALTFTNSEETIQKGKTSVVVKRLEIASELTKMPYELEGEFCEALPKTEFTNGTYTGSLLAEIKKGSIGWE